MRFISKVWLSFFLLFAGAAIAQLPQLDPTSQIQWNLGTGTSLPNCTQNGQYATFPYGAQWNQTFTLTTTSVTYTCTPTGWVAGGGSGSGTVGNGSSLQIAYYPANGTAVAGVPLNPTPVGGTNDGSTDSSGAINAFLNSGGSYVLSNICQGDDSFYSVASPIQITQSSTLLHGSGAGQAPHCATTITPQSSTGDALHVLGPNMYNSSLSDIDLQATGTPTQGIGAYLSDISNASTQFNFNNVTIRNFPIGIWSYGFADFSSERVQIFGAASTTPSMFLFEKSGSGVNSDNMRLGIFASHSGWFFKDWSGLDGTYRLSDSSFGNGGTWTGNYAVVGTPPTCTLTVTGGVIQTPIPCSGGSGEYESITGTISGCTTPPTWIHPIVTGGTHIAAFYNGGISTVQVSGDSSGCVSPTISFSVPHQWQAADTFIDGDLEEIAGPTHVCDQTSTCHYTMQARNFTNFYGGPPVIALDNSNVTVDGPISFNSAPSPPVFASQSTTGGSYGVGTVFFRSQLQNTNGQLGTWTGTYTSQISTAFSATFSTGSTNTVTFHVWPGEYATQVPYGEVTGMIICEGTSSNPSSMQVIATVAYGTDTYTSTGSETRGATCPINDNIPLVGINGIHAAGSMNCNYVGNSTDVGGTGYDNYASTMIQGPTGKAISGCIPGMKVYWGTGTQPTATAETVGQLAYVANTITNSGTDAVLFGYATSNGTSETYAWSSNLLSAFATIPLVISQTGITTPQISITDTDATGSGPLLSLAATSTSGTTGTSSPLYLSNQSTAQGVEAKIVDSGGSSFLYTNNFTYIHPLNLTGAGASSVPVLNLTGAPFTGGSGTSTYPLAYLNDGTAPTTWSTSGTELGINAPSGFAGNFLDFHLNGGASVFNVSSGGAGTFTSITATPNTSTMSSISTTKLAFTGSRKSSFVCTAGGTITITNSLMTATSDVIITLSAAGGTITTAPAMKTVTAGTGFTVLCGATDTSTYTVTILN